MPITEIGLNTNLTNLTPINFSSIPQTASDILTQTPVNANINTGHWFAFLILIVVWLISYLAFSDKTQFSNFKFGDVRALNLAFGVCSLIGITNLEIGFYTNLHSIYGFFILIFSLGQCKRESSFYFVQLLLLRLRFL